MIAPELISRLDLPTIIGDEGIDLIETRKGYKFRCPFHSDKYPSGSLRNNGKWRWHCFGCGEGGDAVDFVMRRHNLDFKGALTYLGIETGSLSPEEKARIKKKKQKRKVAETFTRWELAAIDELRDTISTAYKISGRWQTLEDFERGAMWLDPIGDLQGQLDILMMGDLADRRGIYNRWKQRGGYF